MEILKIAVATADVVMMLLLLINMFSRETNKRSAMIDMCFCILFGLNTYLVLR